MTRVVRGLGWTLIVAGAVVLLYVVYLLWFTGLGTSQAQQELEAQWVDAVALPEPGEPSPEPDRADALVEDEGPDIDVGDAFAALWFERDGEPVVADDVLFVVEDVTVDMLKLGPGHYPETDLPGGPGNLAIAGHRTTYGAPFWDLDELAEGDTIHVMDRDGQEWVYEFVEQQIVSPAEVWVIGQDPLDTGRPTVTLTTCHPRHSAAQRLIAFGELVGDPREPDGADSATESELQELPET